MRVSRTVLALVAAAGSVVPSRAQSIEMVSVADDGSPGNHASTWPSISDDGRFAVFSSFADSLVSGDHNANWDVFLRDRASGTTRRISADAAGGDANGGSDGGEISADGRFVVFTSYATDLVASDTNATSDVFLHELATGVTTLLSRTSTAQGNGVSYHPSISADGSLVVFVSAASNLVPSDTNGRLDVFLCDRSLGTIERVSVASDGTQADGESFDAMISRDGRYVTFSSRAKNLDPSDTSGGLDVYLRDLVARTTSLVSISDDGLATNGESFVASVSDDPPVVSFMSNATNLVSDGEDDAEFHVYARRVASASTERIDVDLDGQLPPGYSDAETYLGRSISADGGSVAFSSHSDGLVQGDRNRVSDVFCHDTAVPMTTRWSVGQDGAEADGESFQGALSSDGRFATFNSTAGTLVPQGSNGWPQIYVRERRFDAASTRSYGQGHAGTNGVPSLTAASDPVLNHDLTLDVGNSRGQWTFALVLVGPDEADIPTSWGGTLLVDAAWSLPLALPIAGGALEGRIPADESLTGGVLDVQALVLDPGASKGVAFTPGLELTFGY